jgi:glycosyltransferase involved in cell wall biosynthesis
MADAEIIYSVIIPAYNEEKLLADCLDSLKTATADIESQTELIVVDNASTDKTAEIARQNGAKVVFEPHRQIARARNAGADKAQGRYLFFIDADTTISSNLFNEARRKLESGKIIGGGARVEFSRQPRGLALFLLKF